MYICTTRPTYVRVHAACIGKITEYFKEINLDWGIKACITIIVLVVNYRHLAPSQPQSVNHDTNVSTQAGKVYICTW